MSINALNSLSLYEYYYALNSDSKKKKSSPLEQEMREYNLTPTDSESLNIALLKKAKESKEAESEENAKPSSYSDRPWADLMYQLNITFNEDPKDDINDIKDKLAELMSGFSDEELKNEISDLENYVQTLYLSYRQNNLGSIWEYSSLGAELDNISLINKANLL